MARRHLDVGWVTLVVAAIEFLAAWGVPGGKTWGRVTAIVIATLAAVSALFTITIYPVWGVVMLAPAVLVCGFTGDGEDAGGLQDGRPRLQDPSRTSGVLLWGKCL